MFKVLVILSHWRLQTTLLNIPGHIGRCDLALRGNGLETTVSQECMTPVGLEPTIPGSVGRCLIHWATGPLSARHRISDTEVTHLGGRKGKAVGLKPALPGSLGRCLVHWAAGPLAERIRISNHGSDLPGWRQRPSMRVTPPPMMGRRGRLLV